MKLLITSVGSLLGQNILDSIESRRDLIHVVGLDANADNPRIYRCDTTYLVNYTEDNHFFNDFNAIVEKEKPDFILPGRDGDSIFLSEIKSKNPDRFKKRIPFGSSAIPRIMLDKYQSYLFCLKNKLPFADSFYYRNENDKIKLEEFKNKHDFPYVIKPKEGFGSNNVYYVLDNENLNELVNNGEFLIQEYLGDPSTILKYKNHFKIGIPLFFQVPENEQYAAQTIISQDGTVGEVFITINTMVHGRAEYTKQIMNYDIVKLVQKYSEVFYKNGWYGPTNFQLKPDRDGKWKVFELNSRLTGTSSARVLLGYDEFGILADLFVPELLIPNLTKKEKVKGQVMKFLHDNLLYDKNVESLKNDKVWKRF